MVPQNWHPKPIHCACNGCWTWRATEPNMLMGFWLTGLALYSNHLGKSWSDWWIVPMYIERKMYCFCVESTPTLKCPAGNASCFAFGAHTPAKSWHLHSNENTDACLVLDLCRSQHQSCEVNRNSFLEACFNELMKGTWETWRARNTQRRERNDHHETIEQHLLIMWRESYTEHVARNAINTKRWWTCCLCKFYLSQLSLTLDDTKEMIIAKVSTTRA